MFVATLQRAYCCEITEMSMCEWDFAQIVLKFMLFANEMLGLFLCEIFHDAFDDGYRKSWFEVVMYSMNILHFNWSTAWVFWLQSFKGFPLMWRRHCKISFCFFFVVRKLIAIYWLSLSQWSFNGVFNIWLGSYGLAHRAIFSGSHRPLLMLNNWPELQTSRIPSPLSHQKKWRQSYGCGTAVKAPEFGHFGW